ncbi:MAG: autotransporter domain-containing protein [Spirochaetaceae bacterium]|jgi:hypothetical protein|nr:autotransporter domain-containing protein [Spirochaetaceae bacterium]
MERKILKKSVLICLFLLMVNGYTFSEGGNGENLFPENTITVDMGLLGSNLIVWGLVKNPVFGTAIQYERQISRYISVAGRFEYRGVMIPAAGDSKFSSYSAEGHVRCYPGANRFFLDAMAGYGLFTYQNVIGKYLSHHFKYGGRLGWRVDFGKPGGLVLEPSIGYYGVVGEGNIRFVDDFDGNDTVNELLNELSDYIIKGYFIGGPQISLGFGYRF